MPKSLSKRTLLLQRLFFLGLSVSSSGMAQSAPGSNFELADCARALLGENDAFGDADTVISWDPSRTGIPASRLHIVRSPAPEAQKRPVLVLIPGGPGLSSVTIKPLEILSSHFDLIFVDPPGAGQSPTHVLGRPETDPYEMYEWFIRHLHKNLSRTVAQFFGGRSIILLGHSYGGVFAADLAARYATASPPIVGLIPISSFLSRSAHTIAADNREHARRNDPSYEKYKAMVMDWTLDRERGNLVKWVRERTGIGGDGPIQEEDILKLAKDFDREAFIRWAVAYGDLIWNSRDEAQVRALLEADRTTCSPESVRVLQFPWRRDYNRNDWMISQLATLPQVRKLIISGGNDRMLPSAVQALDAERMGGRSIIISKASHFVFTSNLTGVATAIQNEFGDMDGSAHLSPGRDSDQH